MRAAGTGSAFSGAGAAWSAWWTGIDQGRQFANRDAVVRDGGANDGGDQFKAEGVGHGYSFEVAAERVSRSAFAALNLTDRLAAISMAAPV